MCKISDKSDKFLSNYCDLFWGPLFSRHSVDKSGACGRRVTPVIRYTTKKLVYCISYIETKTQLSRVQTSVTLAVMD